MLVREIQMPGGDVDVTAVASSSPTAWTWLVEKLSRADASMHQEFLSTAWRGQKSVAYGSPCGTDVNTQIIRRFIITEDVGFMFVMNGAPRIKYSLIGR